MAAGNFEKYVRRFPGGQSAGVGRCPLPATSMWKGHLSEYHAPKNFNFWYFFGSLALLVLVIQIVTGIFLVMHYKPDAVLNAYGVPGRFASVEYIMRDVPGLAHPLHALHRRIRLLHRGLSPHVPRPALRFYRKPRELTWLFGVGIFLCLMGEAFFGYLLPWGRCPTGAPGDRGTCSGPFRSSATICRS